RFRRARFCHCAAVREKSSSILPLQSFVTSVKYFPRPTCTDSFKTQRSKRSCTVIFSPILSCSSCVVGRGTRLSRAELEKSRVQREAGSSSQGYSAVTPGLEESSKQSNAQRTIRMSLCLSCYQVWTAGRAAAGSTAETEADAGCNTRAALQRLPDH